MTMMMAKGESEYGPNLHSTAGTYSFVRAGRRTGTGRPTYLV
jgi:hypothetical protein